MKLAVFFLFFTLSGLAPRAHSAPCSLDLELLSGTSLTHTSGIFDATDYVIRWLTHVIKDRGGFGENSIQAILQMERIELLKDLPLAAHLNIQARRSLEYALGRLFSDEALVRSIDVARVKKVVAELAAGGHKGWKHREEAHTETAKLYVPILIDAYPQYRNFLVRGLLRDNQGETFMVGENGDKKSFLNVSNGHWSRLQNAPSVFEFENFKTGTDQPLFAFDRGLAVKAVDPRDGSVRITFNSTKLTRIKKALGEAHSTLNKHIIYERKNGDLALMKMWSPRTQFVFVSINEKTEVIGKPSYAPWLHDYKFFRSKDRKRVFLAGITKEGSAAYYELPGKPKIRTAPRRGSEAKPGSIDFFESPEGEIYLAQSFVDKTFLFNMNTGKESVLERSVEFDPRGTLREPIGFYASAKHRFLYRGEPLKNRRRLLSFLNLETGETSVFQVWQGKPIDFEHQFIETPDGRLLFASYSGNQIENLEIVDLNNATQHTLDLRPFEVDGRHVFFEFQDGELMGTFSRNGGFGDNGFNKIKIFGKAK
jgi:hypothetical protein